MPQIKIIHPMQHRPALIKTSPSLRLLPTFLGLAMLAALPSGMAAERVKVPAQTVFTGDAVMVPMDQLGPQPRPADLKGYAQVIHVGAGEKFQTVASALAAVSDASPGKRHAILVAAGTYTEPGLRMKPYVDLYGGFAAGDWKNRDIYEHATILDAKKKGPVVLGADHARLDGFVITGGEQGAHGGGIVCDGTSPTIVNNLIRGNNTLRVEIAEGLGKQVGHEGGGIALLSGSSAYVANNLICENTTEIGDGGGITARGNVHAKILRNVFCNNICGVKDDQMYHGKVGSRSSTGGAISCSEESSLQISFNVIVLGAAVLNNDGGGIWVEGNSMPRITYNWIVGNHSGDDGGGIYVMGNLYYDDEGKRHDSAPDGPVTIEDNLIAGNDTGRGAPGGIRVSRFGRVDLRRNRILANGAGGAHGAEGGVICVLQDNIIADNGGRRQPATPVFRLTGDIAAGKFDAQRFVTEITTGAPLGTEPLTGSVVRIGSQWSIVKASSPTGLVLWGKITDKSTKVEVLNDYAAQK
jgi:hypothetical protein